METPLVIDNEGMDRLEEFLLSERAPKTAMGLDVVDGFVTGMVCAGFPTPFADCLPEIWGGEVPAYASQAEADDIEDLILRLSGLVSGLLASDAKYNPIYAEDAPFSTVAAWAHGFMRAVTVAPDVWDGLLQERQELLLPVLSAAVVVSDTDESRNLRAAMEDEQMRREVRASIPHCIQSIYDFFASEQSVFDEPFRRKEPKVGRNEFCPCGSGKKYKKCCGRR